MVIVRMPPSPTGSLHLGTARTALFNYLFAKNKNGKIIFRWEDTDQERSKAEFETEILEGLTWLGMDFEKESFLFCRQSENASLHKEWLLKLWDMEKVFPCFVTPKELDELRETAQKEKQNFVFWSPDRDTPRDVLIQKMESGLPYVWRLRSPRNEEVSFDDLIRGSISVSSETLGDFVVARSDGSVLYLLANVLDDWTQGVTHIFRGEDHISNTPKQVLLYKSLDVAPPAFGHIPLVLDHQKRKLSKRNVLPGVCVLIRDFQEAGFVPEAVVNGLALTGWNPKSTEEVFSLEELVSVFDVSHINGSAAQYNFEKMEWLNTHWIRNMEVSALKHHLSVFTGETYDDTFDAILHVARQKSRTLQDVQQQVSYFVSDPGIDPEHMFHEKMGINASLIQKVFPVLIDSLLLVSEEHWNEDSLRDASVSVIQSLGLKNGQVLHPFRVALSNQAVSVGPFEIASLLGKQETLHRLDRALKSLN